MQSFGARHPLVSARLTSLALVGLGQLCDLPAGLMVAPNLRQLYLERLPRLSSARVAALHGRHDFQVHGDMTA